MPHRALARRVDALIAALCHADSSPARARLRRRLTRLGPSAAPRLVSHLAHADAMTRWEILNLLGGFAAPATLDGLPLVARDPLHDGLLSKWEGVEQSSRRSVMLAA